MKLTNINSKMKRHTNREGKFQYAPAILAEFNVSGIIAPFEFHSHQQFELFILQEGQVHYLINNQVYRIEPGTVILLDGSELHKVQLIDEEAAYVRSIVHFDPNWVKPSLEASEADFLLTYFSEFHHRLFKLRETSDWQTLLTLVKQLSELTAEKYSSQNKAIIKIRLAHLLSHIYKAEKRTVLEEEYDKSEKAKLAEEIASYIQQHFDEKWTIEQLAKDLNLSQSYASHLFKEVTGYTIMDYLMNYRLIQAKAILSMSSEEISIKDCAYQCGFESDAHFNRFFKKKTGMTPYTFKKNQLKERKINV